MKIIAVSTMLFLVGCSSIGPCSYPLSQNGWVRTNARPPEILTDLNRSAHWFEDEQGDILVCPSIDARDACGSYYEIFEKTKIGYVVKEEIVCLT